MVAFLELVQSVLACCSVEWGNSDEVAFGVRHHDLRPHTASCGSCTTGTPFETQLLKIPSIRSEGPETISPTSLVRGVLGTACSP